MQRDLRALSHLPRVGSGQCRMPFVAKSIVNGTWSRGPDAGINCDRLPAVKLIKMRENCTEGCVATKLIRDHPLEP